MESTGVQKRPRVERDIRVMPEVVELNIQMEGPPKKPKAVESPVVHQSSSSAAFSAPSTSFASQDRFVLVDPATLRPDELPPGTVLLRSVQPVVNMPQPQQPVPANVPVQEPRPSSSNVTYFSCDANSNWGHPVVQMPNIQISVNTGPGAATISAPSTSSRNISRKHQDRSNIIVLDEEEEDDIILID
ncbi:uncharacterized protein LOC124360826 isoform X3 [Homalodisca vitripennis]|uniref:uncharacterized protein LOC124360826 isoform X3 n=1 Tax=Homalodisca vitripennis TaxID=197043 RepID=UPI001EEB83C7|nr:uncharacterized protein LOC124360826 isoform X3 [Homalodisca vitripennis]